LLFIDPHKLQILTILDILNELSDGFD